MTEESVTDRRRDAGARTKQRLLDATLALLAERGEDGVTLRDITTEAETNVASVSYHFGSLGALCCATAKQAITRLLDEQTRAAAGARATTRRVEDIARAVAQPIIDALSDPSSPDRALLRIFDRTLSGLGGRDARLDQGRRAAGRRRADGHASATRFPGVGDDELRFRWDCVAGILRGLVAGTARTDLDGKCPDDLERMLLPVLAGALAAPRV